MTSSGAEFAICLSNLGYEESLIVRKVYLVLQDEEALRHGLVRVVDESDEDYLFPEGMFLRIELPEAARKLLHEPA